MGEDLLEHIQTDLAALNLELSAQCLAIRRGLQDTQRTGAIYADHPLATSLDSIAFLRKAMDGAQEADLRERASRLYYACLSQFIRLDLLMMDEVMDRFLVHAGIAVHGERLTFAGLLPWIISQHDFDKRETLREKVSPLLGKGGQLKAKIWQETLQILREDFGYPDYIRFSEEKKGSDLDALGRKCRALLQATDLLYERHISAWTEREMDRPLRMLSRYHAMYLLHLRDFDGGFPEAHLMPVLRRTLGTMGLEGPLENTIFVHRDGQRGLSIPSRCIPLRIPDEIHVTISAAGGLSDYETLFHEVGHGLHLAHTDPSLPYPYRHLPRSFALSECFGFLFQHLTFEPAWLAVHTVLSPEQIASLCYHKTLKLLCLVRRYVGKFLFECDFFSRAAIDDGGTYKKWMERATGFVYEPDAALLDLEEEFYSADYLRAWIGEASLRAYLKHRFGEDWFTRQQAGSFLCEIWREGERWHLDDLLNSLGQDPLDLSPLEQTFSALDSPP